MKISGFTIIRNAITNDYPVVEAITSILPIVYEMVVLVGKSEDDTEELIRSIGSPKIKIFHSVWDPAHFEGGRILAVETDKAFALVDPRSDWAFYIQADEVVHEKYHEVIRQNAEKHLANQEVEGLVFRYLHFYGNYDYIGDSRKWYSREVRVIRNDKSIHSYRDAQGFRKNGNKIKVKPVDAYIYHYGWVKSPEQMMKKNLNFVELWQEEGEKKKSMDAQSFFDFSEFDSLARFTGTHPVVMQQRIKAKNWQVNMDISKKKFSFRNRLLYWFEKYTGIRPFEFRNYRII